MYYIIYQTSFIGDIILSASMIKTIRQVDPQSKIIFITTPIGETILRNDKRIDRIIIYDKRLRDKGITGLLKKTREIKNIINGDESIFISPHRFIRASILGYESGSKLRAGFSGSALSLLYNRRVHYRFGIHEIQRNFELLGSVFEHGLKGIKAERPLIFPSEADRMKVEKMIYDFFHSRDRIISIAPGSVWLTKRWPYEYFKELIVNLLNNDFKVILIGGENDKDLCDMLASGKVLNLAGRLTILESAAAVSVSTALITNDSAPLHIASAVNIPTVAIFGATTPYLGFGPLADRSTVLENKEPECRPCGRHGSQRCREKHFACMMNITPKMVLDAVMKII